MSRASTISAEEKQMALTEKEFAMIKQKMDKIDHCLNEMYKNWHAEYGNAIHWRNVRRSRTSINLIWISMSLNIECYTSYYDNQG